MKFKGTASGLMITFFIGAIIISFALTGFDGAGFNTTGTNAVAKVGDTIVSYSEYNRALQAQIARFSQIFGGKSLTQAQIKQFRLKENTLRSLVQQKLLLNMSLDLDFNASMNEVRDEIKKAEYFKTNGKFDVNKYRQVLKANKLTPATFEKMNQETIRMQNMQSLFSSFAVSKKAVESLVRAKETTATVNAVEIKKEELVKYIPVTSKEIKDFVTKKENASILNSLYNSSKNEFNKPARVKARHILFKGKDSLKKAQATRKKLTTKNFAKIAGKETEDASGKGAKGGDLGWFGKGRMVPEFEKAAFSMKPGSISNPIKTNFGHHIIYVERKDPGVTKTLDQVKDQIAKKHLQKTNREALKKLQEVVRTEVTAFLNTGNVKGLESYSKKYGLKLIKDAQVNAIDSKANSISLKPKNVIDMINTKNTTTSYGEDSAITEVIYKATKINEVKDLSKAVEKELASSSSSFSNKIQEELLKELEKTTKVVTYPKML